MDTKGMFQDQIDSPTQFFVERHADLLDRIVVDVNVEMIAKEHKETEGEFVETGFIVPREFLISASPFDVDSKLLSFATEAISKYELDRTCMHAVLPADGHARMHPINLSKMGS